MLPLVLSYKYGADFFLALICLFENERRGFEGKCDQFERMIYNSLQS